MTNTTSMIVNNTSAIATASDGGVPLVLDEEEIWKIYYEKNFEVIALYIPVFLSAFVANVLVIVVVIKYHFMRNITNYFLVNLSIADLLVTLVCMPSGILTAYTSLWNFGELTCKITNYLQCVAVASSIFTITAMAVDRYLAITQPFGLCRCFNKRSTVVTIGVLWALSLLFFSPMLVVYRVSEDGVELPLTPPLNFTLRHCYEDWRLMGQWPTKRVFGIMSYTFVFATPGIIILFAYALMGKTLCSVKPPFDNNSEGTQQSCFRLVRERKRVAWILLLLVLIFCCCWLPYHAFSLLVDTAVTADGGWFSQSLKSYLLLLGHANSALNPIVYCIMSRNFRKSVKCMMVGGSTQGQGPFDGIGRNRLQVKWVDSSRSSQRLCMQKFNDFNATNHHQQHLGDSMKKHNNVSRMQSSQKTTKTCAV